MPSNGSVGDHSHPSILPANKLSSKATQATDGFVPRLAGKYHKIIPGDIPLLYGGLGESLAGEIPAGTSSLEHGVGTDLSLMVGGGAQRGC